MASPITQAMKQICEEKGISYESVLETIEAALGAAYRKDFGNKLQNIKVNFDPDTAGIRVFDVKEVVEDIDLEELDNKAEEEAEAKEEEKGEKKEEKSAEGGSQSKADAPREHASGGKEGKKEEKDEEPDEEAVKFNPKTQIMISDAKDIKKSAKVGDEIKVELEVPGAFGRMAAQTAKQVITQKLREAERETIFDEYKDNVDEIINAVVQRREGKIVLIDLGRATGIIRPEDQVPGEYYRPGERIKVYVVKVEMTTKGPEILLSRSHPEMVRRLFELEIPEIAGGTVEIKAISREAGSRSKVAVTTSEENVDPIGSCIGQRGTRIQTIIAELGGEKIDIIEWSEDAETFIMNALSPAKVTKVELNEAEKSALATVASDQLSLAIGKGGQNVRLAAKLTGWKINVAEEGGDVVADSEQGELKKEEVETEEIKEEKEEAKEEVKSASGGEEKEEKEVKKEKETKKEEEKEEKKEKKTKAKKSAEGGSASGGEEDKK
ncbi:transcription termination/antitermination protein NusA [Candidatus Saccharibacteria bacterium]|nr:transcription termination/antitermination protein NusA [Candidatus Saccharibacteria bacterium]NIV72763.1 transcription termination/antitermination protein NusA [Calditrichia bacterium]NIV99935.1 transcription termination/antitermination protein NusA [Candidatus Saccharibacteria bacterium]NIW80311.1 transcription termination/antitermination protein NusA [Calditrichia bacterium]